MSITLHEKLWLLAWFYHSLYRFRTKWKHFLRSFAFICSDPFGLWNF